MKLSKIELFSVRRKFDLLLRTDNVHNYTCNTLALVALVALTLALVALALVALVLVALALY